MSTFIFWTMAVCLVVIIILVTEILYHEIYGRNIWYAKYIDRLLGGEKK